MINLLERLQMNISVFGAGFTTTTFANNALRELKTVVIAFLAFKLMKEWKQQNWVKVLTSIAFALLLWYFIDGKESTLDFLLETVKGFLGIK